MVATVSSKNRPFFPWGAIYVILYVLPVQYNKFEYPVSVTVLSGLILVHTLTYSSSTPNPNHLPL